MANEVILYDIANRQNRCWNANVWKTRALLNFTNLPYRTEWVEYPDIAPTLKSLGVAAHGPDSGAFVSHTLPTIRLPGGEYVMESRAIADAIEKTVGGAGPPLHLDNPQLPRVIAATAQLTPALKSHIMAAVPRDVLNPRSAAYWNETRSGFLGMPVDDFERSADRHAEWLAAKPHVDELAALLKEHAGGPFFLGSQPSYADVVVAAYLKGASVVAKGAHRMVIESDKVFQDLFDAAQPWLQRDDH